jgi:hypothetical protein
MSRYVKIATRFWSDEKTSLLKDEEKLLFLYVMTSPHSNMVGFYVLPKLYIMHDLEWSTQRLSKPFDKLLEDGFIKYCDKTSVILIPNFLKYNTIQNRNQAIGAIKALKEVPKNSLYPHFYECLKQYAKPFVKLFTEQLPILLDKRYANTETETETETENRNRNRVQKQNIEIKHKNKSTHRNINININIKKYAEFVRMTEEEYQKLIEQYGEKATKKMIEILDNYKGATGKTYKSDYRAILSWVVKRYQEEEKQRKPKSEPKSFWDYDYTGKGRLPKKNDDEEYYDPKIDSLIEETLRKMEQPKKKG